MTYMKFTIVVIITIHLVFFFGLCLGVEKKIFKEIMHFHYITYITTS